MQISLHADYACRVLIYLAVIPRASIPEISKAFGISHNHLVKVVHRLGKEGFIKTMRGKGGGIHLARASNDINIGDVIRVMEPNFHLVECFDRSGNTCKITPGCGLTHAMREASTAFLTTLAKYSLSDVVKNESSIKRMLVASVTD